MGYCRRGNSVGFGESGGDRWVGQAGPGLVGPWRLPKSPAPTPRLPQDHCPDPEGCGKGLM